MTNNRKKALDTYKEEIGATPLLSDEKERELAERIQQGDDKAIATLVEANLRFVLTIANGYRDRGVSYDDLVSEGNVGLLKAAKRFSPYPGKRFVKFAAPIIRSEMERFIEQHTGLYKVPRAERTAAETRMSRPVSVDAPIPVGSQNNFNLLNLLENADSPYADSALLKETSEARLQQVLTLLDERQRQVISLIYGIGGERHTMAEVGVLMQLTRERVRQIRDKALRRLSKVKSMKL